MKRNGLRVARWSIWPVLALAAAAPVSAHHSAAAYDYTVTKAAEGTLKAFRWSSPHCAIVIVVKGADGGVSELKITSAAPAIYVRQGFKPDDFKAGDKVAVSWHPGRADSSIGVLNSLKLKDGRTFKE